MMYNAELIRVLVPVVLVVVVGLLVWGVVWRFRKLRKARQTDDV